MSKPFLVQVFVKREFAIDFIDKLKKNEMIAGYDLPHLSQKPNGHDAPHKSNGLRPPRKTSVHLEKTGEEAVVEAIFKHGPQTPAKLAAVFVSQGRSAKSISSSLYAVKKRGDIMVQPDGTYTLSKTVRDKLRYHDTKKTKKKK